jgi:hypothetical protein
MIQEQAQDAGRKIGATVTGPIPERDIYPLHEAAQRLGGVSEALLHKLRAAGLVRFTKIGARVFLSANEIERLIRDGTEAA